MSSTFCTIHSWPWPLTSPKEILKPFGYEAYYIPGSVQVFFFWELSFNSRDTAVFSQNRVCACHSSFSKLNHTFPWDIFKGDTTIKKAKEWLTQKSGRVHRRILKYLQCFLNEGLGPWVFVSLSKIMSYTVFKISLIHFIIKSSYPMSCHVSV